MMKIKSLQLSFIPFALSTLVLAGCSNSSNEGSTTGGSTDGTTGDTLQTVNQQYEVQLTNMTNGQTFLEPAFIIHPGSEDFWQIGQVATVQLEELAESGAANGIASIAADNSYSFEAADSSVEPGQSRTVMISNQSSANTALTILTRLDSTNDGFTGANAIDLSGLTSQGQSILLDRWALDAGTEKNLESVNLGSLDTVRPSGPNDVFGSEFNHVSVHPGVITEIEPIPGNTSQLNQKRKFDNPVIRIRVTRL